MTEQENTRYTRRLQWRWREYVQHNESDADWSDWGPWEDIPAGDTFSVTGREEFETRLTYADAVPPTIVSGVRWAGKNPVPPVAPPGGVWSGTVKSCGVTDRHAPHTWQSGDDGFLGGGEDFLCPGVREGSDAPRPHGYRGTWPPKAGQPVSSEDVAALYRAAVKRRLRDGGDPS